MIHTKSTWAPRFVAVFLAGTAAPFWGMSDCTGKRFENSWRSTLWMTTRMWPSSVTWSVRTGSKMSEETGLTLLSYFREYGTVLEKLLRLEMWQRFVPIFVSLLAGGRDLKPLLNQIYWGKPHHSNCNFRKNISCIFMKWSILLLCKNTIF